jgi:hypothetical protein
MMETIEAVTVTWIHDGPEIKIEWRCTSRESAWDTCKSIEDDLDAMLGENIRPLRLAGKPPPDCIRLTWDLFKKEWWSYDNACMAGIILTFQSESKSDSIELLH